MRRGAYSLSGLVLSELNRDPLSGEVFVFLNRRLTCIKLLRWEPGSGFVLYSKHLEKGTYTRPHFANKEGVFCPGLNWRFSLQSCENLRFLTNYLVQVGLFLVFL